MTVKRHNSVVFGLGLGGALWIGAAVATMTVFILLPKSLQGFRSEL